MSLACASLDSRSLGVGRSRIAPCRSRWEATRRAGRPDSTIAERLMSPPIILSLAGRDLPGPLGWERWHEFGLLLFRQSGIGVLRASEPDPIFSRTIGSFGFFPHARVKRLKFRIDAPSYHSCGVHPGPLRDSDGVLGLACRAGPSPRGGGIGCR